MMKNVLAGIIGAGGISNYHIGGYRVAGIEVEAIVDPDTSRAEAQARKYGIKRVFSSVEEFCKKSRDISLVSVCTPNSFHSLASITCLEAGMHVFCEKPPALDAMGVLKMKAAAEKAGRVLMFDFNNRARPEAQAIMRYIVAGETGPINSCQALWIRRCGIPGFGGWFTQKDLSGGGPVIDLLHMLDLALYFMGFPEPEWVIAQTFREFASDSSFKGPWGIPDVKDGVMDVETAAHAFIRFKTGQVLFTRNSWAEMNKREEVSVTFQGTKAGGMIRRFFDIDGIDETAIDTCQLYTMEHGKPVNKDILAGSDEKMGRESAVVNFVNTVLGKEEPLSTPAEAVILMKIVDAIYASAEKGAPVRIGE
jgi:predicted dehydrogenase